MLMAAMSAVRMRRQKSLSQARMRRKLWPTAERTTGGIAGATFEVTAAVASYATNVADRAFQFQGRSS